MNAHAGIHAYKVQNERDKSLINGGGISNPDITITTQTETLLQVASEDVHPLTARVSKP